MNKEYCVYAYNKREQITYVLTDSGFEKSGPNLQRRDFLKDDVIKFLENGGYQSDILSLARGEYKLYACHASEGGAGYNSRTIKVT